MLCIYVYGVYLRCTSDVLAEVEEPAGRFPPVVDLRAPPRVGFRAVDRDGPAVVDCACACADDELGRATRTPVLGGMMCIRLSLSLSLSLSSG